MIPYKVEMILYSFFIFCSGNFVAQMISIKLAYNFDIQLSTILARKISFVDEADSLFLQIILLPANPKSTLYMC